MDKSIIFKKILETLKENFKVLVDSALEAKEASTNEESKAENKYDTRGLEASYLASGQARRAQDLKELIYITEKVQIKDFDKNSKIGVSALVELAHNGEENKLFFLLPVGGVHVEYQERNIQSISIESPMGKALLNSQVGDDFEINKNEYEILRVF